jgi:hypothetical protein
MKVNWAVAATVEKKKIPAISPEDNISRFTPWSLIFPDKRIHKDQAEMEKKRMLRLIASYFFDF